MPLKSLVTLWVMIADTFQISPMSLLHIQRSGSINFLTVTMPAIGKLLDRSLTEGKLLSFKGVAKVYKGTPYPVFLRELFEQIFDKEGFLRDFIDPVIIRRLRTLLFMFYKYELEPTSDQIAAAEEKFLATDMAVKCSFSEEQLSAIRPVIHGVFSMINPDDLVGRHSNGATQGGYTNIEKRDCFRIIPSLCNYYGLKYFFNTYNHYKWYLSENGVPEIVEPSARVAFVPKDSRGPRTICIEPHERMFIQQGLMAEMYQIMESNKPYKGRVNFTSQYVNANLALQASYDRKYATLDLKDASDLVSWELVLNTVPSNWRDALSALRTPTAQLPSGTICTLKKFAPMGSALCFPVETILFAAVCQHVTREYGVPGDYSVFGDDIIVPTQCAGKLMDVLEELGFRVNREKSFTLAECWFRESCGAEYCDGYDVTPMRVSRKYNHQQRLVQMTGLIDLANTAYLRGYRNLRGFFLRKLRLSGFKPLFAPDALLGDNYTNYHVKRRWNPALQRIECKVSHLTSQKAKKQDESIRYRHWLETTANRSSIGDGFEADVGRPTVLVKDHWRMKPYELPDQQFIDLNLSVRG